MKIHTIEAAIQIDADIRVFDVPTADGYQPVTMLDNTMYIILDEKSDWIYSIVSDLDEAMDAARMLNAEENQRYHHYVVEECTAEFAQCWLEAWKKVMDS